MMNRAWGAAIAAALCLAACSSNKAASPDAKIILIDAAIDAPPKPIDAMIDAAPVYDFSCEGSAAPTAPAATTVAIAGTITRITDTGALPSTGPATSTIVTINRSSDGSAEGSATSDGSGDFTLPAQDVASGSALDDYIQYASSDADRGTRVYPEAPLAATPAASVPVLIMSETSYQNIASLAFSVLSVPGGPLNAADGTLAVEVTDCAGTPIPSGVTLIAMQGTTDVSTSQLNTSQGGSTLGGGFLVFNVPPGATTVGATYGTHHFRTHVVPSLVNYITATQIRPGS